MRTVGSFTALLSLAVALPCAAQVGAGSGRPPAAPQRVTILLLDELEFLGDLTPFVVIASHRNEGRPALRVVKVAGGAVIARMALAGLRALAVRGRTLAEAATRPAWVPVAAPAGGRVTPRAERWRIDVSLRPAGADRRLELSITVAGPG